MVINLIIAISVMKNRMPKIIKILQYSLGFSKSNFFDAIPFSIESMCWYIIFDAVS